MCVNLRAEHAVHRNGSSKFDTAPTSVMSVISNIVKQFIAEHPEELVDGKLRVCIGGGAGFIGSHIAKQLMADVRSTRSLRLRTTTQSIT
jgi:hypothetical protein